MPLIEQEAKFLTEEVLGECWHNHIPQNGCTKCHVPEWVMNRTFTTPDDFFALRNALVKSGEWDEFCEISHTNTLASDGNMWNYSIDDEQHWFEFFKWLTSTDPDGVLRLAPLILGWKEGESE